MANNTAIIMFYGLLAGFATLFGIYAIRRKREFALTYSHYFNSAAAGLILALVFFDILPEAIELTSIAFPATFLGFFLFYLLENFVVIHSGSELHFHKDDDTHKIHMASSRLGIMAFSGLAFHSLIDGVIIGLGFEISLEVGTLASIAVISHEVSEGVTSFSLINESLPDKATFLSIVIAIATPAGAFISLFFVTGLSKPIIGVMLALAAGTFIYVAASDLIPATHESHCLKNLLAFTFGAIFIALLSLI
ncbi:MAG: ZIP family metal transporter [Candidatus Hodarchaeales archaeon]